MMPLTIDQQRILIRYFEQKDEGTQFRICMQVK